MSGMTTSATPHDLPTARELGRVLGEEPGPTLIAVGGIHGNELGGVRAARRVLARLSRGDVAVCGEVVAFAGNLAAMAEGLRYHAKDLNRQWNERAVARLDAGPPEAELDSEDREQLALLAAIREAIGRARGPVYLVDLHTTSASGVPFVIFGDTLPQRHFVRHLPLPIIMGLEEQVDGVLAEYWTRQGCVTFTVEGGQHEDPGAVDNLEAALLLAAQEAGVFAHGALVETRAAHALLEGRRGDLPRVMEVVSRHAIAEEDHFKMEPGFRNLDHARAGQLLAHDKGGAIRAPRDGLVLLPLYQGLGADGFFWGRSVSTARLLASEAVRHLELDRFLDWLPGVRRDVTHPSRFLVNTHIARLYPLDVFHVLGYRRIRERSGRLVVERQVG